MLKDKTIENFMKQTNNIYDKWDQVINMLHEYRKYIKYLTFTNFISHQTKNVICKEFKVPLFEYLKFKFSCNPIKQKKANIKAKKFLKQYLRVSPNFGFTRGIEVISYIPFNERPRPIVLPPPPPPILTNIRMTTATITPPRQNIPPPPPPPHTIHEINLNTNMYPFQSSPLIPRTPPPAQRSQMRNSLSLFRR